MRTTLWRYHLGGGGCALALAYVSLPFPPLRIAALVALCLATTLHLDTVAEGVERPEQATALAELGCYLA